MTYFIATMIAFIVTMLAVQSLILMRIANRLVWLAAALNESLKSRQTTEGQLNDGKIPAQKVGAVGGFKR